MTTSETSNVRATAVRVGPDALEVTLVDGRAIHVPIAWFPRLAGATPEQRADWRLIGKGIGIRWDPIDEDISVERLLGGLIAARPSPGPGRHR